MVKVGDDALDAKRGLGGISKVCKANSFAPSTLVAMARGVWLPIEDVEEGDQFVAYDPETGEYGERAVLDLIGDEGLKDLVVITVNDATITATAGHPFWVQSEQAWVDAE